VQLALTPRPPSARARKERRGSARNLPFHLGRYTLFDHIGKGGMADIYLARAESGLGASRLVVIKEVLPELADLPRFAEMLASEAKLASQLNHANIVTIEHLGREEATLYIAMEYVEGLDLREVLRRCAKAKIPLPVEFSLRIVAEALRGLDYAHRKRGEDGKRLGVVHRDVSPSNVLLSFDGEVKLCDFGIARANALVEALPEEAIQGKAGYMSPEHARGDHVDARSDVFAVGIILWELLAGRRLYKIKEGERLLDLAREANIPDLPLRDLPNEAHLHAIVRRALETNADKRYPGASSMLCDLEEYAAQNRMIASPIRFGEWLVEHFGRDVVDVRRARERVVRALALGPAATLLPISKGGSDLPPREEIEDCTPSTFLVVERAVFESPRPSEIETDVPSRVEAAPIVLPEEPVEATVALTTESIGQASRELERQERRAALLTKLVPVLLLAFALAVLLLRR
jgi:serine/threonine-protein kinase